MEDEEDEVEEEKEKVQEEGKQEEEEEQQQQQQMQVRGEGIEVEHKEEEKKQKEEENKKKKKIKILFDPNGDLISLLCETILGLPFEGYKAFLTWATTIYSTPKGTFARLLVKPLLFQIGKGLEVMTDEGGVEHYTQRYSGRSRTLYKLWRKLHCLKRRNVQSHSI